MLCNDCTAKADDCKKRSQQAGLSEDEKKKILADAPQKTFRITTPEYLAKLDHGLGDQFPAFLTHIGGVDKGLIDLMRPLFNLGVQPTAFARLVLEIQRKEYDQRAVEYLELCNLHASESWMKDLPIVDFSTFAAAEGYNGRCPGGAYFESVFIKFMDSLRAYYDADVKKRGASGMYKIDVSYKLPKHLAMYNGKPLFKGLFTGAPCLYRAITI